MEYNFRDIEAKWQKRWQEMQIYKTEVDPSKEPFYVLDMFPYPSGAGLHVGHPLGYIASDIYARYKRLQGYNVLHPMGYDAFGLPAEQYAIQTGQHPEVTTKINTARYREQLDKIGFSFDWSREFRTSDPSYYKWTQWTFIQLFEHYYDTKLEKAQPISKLVEHFESQGTRDLHAHGGKEYNFTPEAWKAMTVAEQREILMNYRLAYLGESIVNWCPELGTVLANDEVSEGLSIRGGYPVIQQKMKQWTLRVSAYAERLLEGLERIDWTDSLKETQRNWIGKSVGAELAFPIQGEDEKLLIFTTRPDTIYGISFMVLAPEHPLALNLAREEQLEEVKEYIAASARKTERERMMDKKVSGVFTGSYALNPITREAIPIWLSDYVLMGYGTGAIMAVPAHDSRDHAFALKYDLPIKQVVRPISGEEVDLQVSSIDSKAGILINSELIDGLEVKEATKKILAIIEERKLGKVKTNYKLRDATFSRQRYWGEPIPIYYKDGIAYPLSEDDLPLVLPEVDKFLPTADGEPPLARAKNWVNREGYPLETSTMPGFAGSSAYYLRYMDPHNDKALVDKSIDAYWKMVNLYIGGTEHATGHLIYSRFWNKFLYDLGLIVSDEPFQKLINQGMIQGRSNFVYRVKGTNTFVSYGLKDQYETTEIHVDVNIVRADKLDLEAFKSWRPEFAEAEFILEDGQYICGWGIEKMSKSMYNVVNPDDIIERYGADTLRIYEMFLGPLEQSKPWDTNGIDGVHRFLRKLWGLFYNADGTTRYSQDAQATKEQLKTLHKLIKKVSEDIEQFSFNTSVPAFMIAVNELAQSESLPISILEPLLIVLSPFAPHIAEELWQQINPEGGSIILANWPAYDEKHLIEDVIKYPVSFNGKTRFVLEVPRDLGKEEVEKLALSHPDASKWLMDKSPKKVIVVPGRIVNIVL